MTSTGTLARPNTTYALQVMRDDDFSDPWGTAMTWAGSVCDVIWDFDPSDVPGALGYSPGACGPEVPGPDWSPDTMPWATSVIYAWLYDVDESALLSEDFDWDEFVDRAYWSDAEFRARYAELIHTAKVLDRYLDWCRLAGRDY